MKNRIQATLVIVLLAVIVIGLAVALARSPARPAPTTAAPPAIGSTITTLSIAPTPPGDTMAEPGTRAATPIPEDDAPMVRVPAGEFLAGSRYEEVVQFRYRLNQQRLLVPYEHDHANEIPQRTIYLDEFYIDRYEVTNARYQRCVEAGGCSPLLSERYQDPAYADYPVVEVTWWEADVFCRWAGKRLPVELEWEKAARGTDGRWWPWGNEWDNSLYEGREELVMPVGSFPVDTSPYGVMDMADNVSEWVADWYLPYPGSRYESADFGQMFKVVRGGDGLFPPLGLSRRTAFRSYASPDGREFTRGFRCARGGTPPTPEPTHTPAPTSAPQVASRDMVLVPAGEFLMGSETGEPNERPEHLVYLDAFYIDRCEVSNAQYVAFLNAIGGHYRLCRGYNCAWVREDDPRERLIRIHYIDGQYTVEAGYEDHAVESVTWYGAQAYCEYYGLRLPTEAEWEKAARGTDGRTWPWGNEWDSARLGRLGILTDPAPACSNPEGASPYGVLNMAGNVGEWVSDWYGEDYYAVSPYRDPRGPADGKEKTVRSIGYFSEEAGYYARITRRFGSSPAIGKAGFRCAVDAESYREP